MKTTVSLGELISPAPLKKCGDGEYPVLSMTMHDGIVLQSNRFKKNLASADTSNYKIVQKNQLVEGFPIDEGVIYVQKTVDNGIMSPAYKVWDIDTGKIEPDFLELALHSEKAMQYYRTKLRGTTARRRSLPTPTLLAMEILLPSKQEQRHSVMMLNDAQEAINTLIGVQEKIDQLVKSTVGSYGHPAIVESERKFLFQRHIAYLKPDHSKINSQYLHAVILSDAVQRQIESKVKGIAQKTLNLSEIKSLRIPLPKMELQNQFADFVALADKSEYGELLNRQLSLKNAMFADFYHTKA